MVSGTNDRFLLTEPALKMVYEILEPNLMFTDYVNYIQEQNNGFVYLVDNYNKSSDPKKKAPPLHLLGAQFPEIDRTRKTNASALIEAQGFSVRIPRNVIRAPNGASEIMDAFETAGFWLAEIVNTNIITALTTGGTTSFSTFSPSANWNATGAMPITDLMDFSHDMKREGYPYRMTDAFLHSTNFHELAKYLALLDVDAGVRSQITGMPTVDRDTITVPVFGMLHECMSGLTEGYILGLDRANPGAELHYYNDSNFSVPSFSYQTVGASGGVQTRTVPNAGFNYYQYEEDDTHDTILQFWVENKVVVKKAYAISYGTGI